MSIEIFANDGRVYMPMGFHFDDGNESLETLCDGEGAEVVALTVSELQSAWPNVIE